MEIPIEKWSSKVSLCEIGALSNNGGTRNTKVKVGGHSTLPFLDFEGEVNKAKVALEVHDFFPEDWPDTLKDFWGKDILSDPVKWAKKAETFNPDLLCIRLLSADPDRKNSSAADVSNFIKEIIKNTKTPLIITGCGNNQKDIEILPEVIDAAKGENCLIGIAVKENYKTIAASCISAGHSIIAESPIDINLAKQLNILISDLGFPTEKIIIHHSTGALGYGIEYTYSVMERTRLAGLTGDKMLSQPMINFVGQEVWKSKEAKAPKEEMPKWGNPEKRAINWEVITAMSYLQSGSDIIVLNHPESMKILKQKIDEMVIK